MIKKYYCFFLLFLPFLLVAQKKKLQETYFEKIEFFRDINNDSLLFYAKKSQKSQDPCTKYLGKISEALVYYKTGDFIKSENICIHVLNTLKNKSNPCKSKILLSAFNRMFWIKKNQNKKKLYRSFKSIDQNIEKHLTNLPILKSDTEDIIDYVENNKNYSSVLIPIRAGLEVSFLS